MAVDPEFYRVFNAVAESGSFSAAAEKLYVTQPAVSRSVRLLEEQLQVTLFMRRRHGVELTSEGNLLLGYTSSALGLLEAGEARLRKLGTLDAGELRIGASDTVSRWILLPVVEEFSHRWPQVSLKIINRTSPDTLDLLGEGGVDIGFVNMPMSKSDTVFEECCRVHDIFVAGQRFTELKDQVLTPAQLSQQPLIMLERASNSRRWVDKHFLNCGVSLSPEIELGAHSLLLDYAAIGLGVAGVIREFSADALQQDGRLFALQVEPPVPERAIAACYPERIALSAAARKFIDLVKQHSRSSYAG